MTEQWSCKCVTYNDWCKGLVGRPVWLISGGDLIYIDSLVTAALGQQDAMNLVSRGGLNNLDTKRWRSCVGIGQWANLTAVMVLGKPVKNPHWWDTLQTCYSPPCFTLWLAPTSRIQNMVGTVPVILYHPKLHITWTNSSGSSGIYGEHG